jgi:hypothetical protein
MTHDAHCRICGSLLYSIVQEGKVAHVTYGTLIDPPTRQPGAHPKPRFFDIRAPAPTLRAIQPLAKLPEQGRPPGGTLI